MRSLHRLTFLVLAGLVAFVGQSRSDETRNKLPADLSQKEKNELASAEKAVQKAKADIEKHQDRLIAYFTGDYPDVSSRLEKAGFPGQSAGMPPGSKFQPGFAGSRAAQELQQRAAKQKAIHDEVHKALQPLVRAAKDEIARKTSEAKEKARKSKDKGEVDTKRIVQEATKHYIEKALPICEKAADDYYHKEMKSLAAKLAGAEKALKQTEETIIKSHAKAGKSK